MEALAIIFLPIALLWVGLAFLTGRSVAPQEVMRRITALSWRGLKWLWRDRRQKGGAGRVKRPPIRYRR